MADNGLYNDLQPQGSGDAMDADGLNLPTFASGSPNIPPIGQVGTPLGNIPPAPNQPPAATTDSSSPGVKTASTPAFQAITPTGDYFSSILQQESGGHQFRKDGSVVTSPAGALGIAQIMPGTGPEAAKLAGLPWDPQRLANDQQYNSTLGKAYFDQQLKTFGSPDKAAAAYNAGPGAVQKAIQKSAQTGVSYLNYLPTETQNYVKSVSGMWGRNFTGSGAPSTDATGGNMVSSSSPPPASGSGKSANMSKALQGLALYQALAPGHTFTPVNYDPFKAAPGGNAGFQLNTNQVAQGPQFQSQAPNNPIPSPTYQANK